MRKNWLMIAAIGAAAACSPALGEDPIQIGDVIHGLSESVASRSVRQIRGGIQYRSPGAFPGTGAAPNGAWTAGNAAFLQSVEFDNANGLRKNARGNLIAYNFGSASVGGTVFNVSTNGSNTIQGPLATFGAAFTGEAIPQRVSSASVSPNNTHIAGTFFESGRLWVMDYNAGSAIGTGTGASLSNFQRSAPLNSIQHTWGCKFLDDDTLIVGYTNISVTEIATIDFNPATNVFGTAVPRVQLLPFNNSGNSRFIDIAYEPSIAPFIFVFSSLFAGATENRVAVLDPVTFVEVATLDLSGSVGTSREVAVGPDRHLYVCQFTNDSQNTTYVDVIDLDRDNDNDVDLFDIISIGSNSSNNHSTRVLLPGTGLDEGGAFNGLDVALTAPQGVGGPQIVGACCITGSVGCLAQITQAACTQFGGTYQGDGSSCANCAPVTGACCDVATGTCTTTDFPACLAAGFLYYGDGTTCQPAACDGPGACCLPDGTCVITQARDCFETQLGYFQGIGSVCTTCPTVAPVLTTYTFDSTNPLPDGRNLSFSVTPDLSGNTPAGTFGNYSGGNFDVFGLIDRAVNTDFADDTNGTLPQDVFGILFASRTDKVFGVEDLNNVAQGGTGTGTGTAAWTFDISGASNLSVEIDMAALGNFELAGATPDSFNFTYSIDGGAPQPLFTSTVQEGNRVYTRMDRGTRVSFPFSESLQDPVAVNGIQLRNQFNRLYGALMGTGNVLTLNFAASSDGSAEVFAFDNITLRGTTTPTTGACCLPNGSCSVTTQAACIGGTFQGLGTNCMPNLCPQPSNGRCCIGARCEIVAAAQCQPAGFAGAVFTSGASDCNASGVLNTPCCFADFNKVGGVTVQDIFDFLGAYFAGSVNANVAGDGVAAPTVQDIFDFLAAYFAAGC